MTNHHASNNTSHGCSLQINGPIYGNVGPAIDLQPSFFKTSNYKSHKDFNPKRVPGTCAWFLEHPIFEKWKESNSNDLLWLSTDPGCGKSVLSKALIDESLVGTEPLILCYFFFKDNDEQNETTTALCALLHQLFRSHENLLQKHAASAVKDCGEALKGDFEELWHVFISAATDPSAGHVICILDALDECEQSDRYKLIEYLESFYNCPSDDVQKQKSKLKFLVTSRPCSDIERRFAILTQAFPTIRLAGEDESEKISNEIGIVMVSKFKGISQRLKLSMDVQISLYDKLQQVINRTYLWLSLILDEIEISLGRTRKKLEEVLVTLPTTVEDAYENILARCNGDKARRILQIIVAAYRPLTLEEIDVALEIQTDTGSQSLCYADLNLEGAENRENMVRNTCGLFVSIVDSRVYLIHQTAREFLLQNNNESPESGKWKHSMSLQEAHQFVSKLCIFFLLFREIKEQPQYPKHDSLQDGSSYIINAANTYVKKYAFLKYSGEYWIDHVQEAHIDAHEWVSKAGELFEFNPRSGSIWFSILQGSSIFWSNLENPKPALYWAVCFKLVDETRFLLRRDVRSNAQGTIGNNFSWIIRAAAANETHGKELMTVFLEEVGNEVKFTADIVKAAMGNCQSGEDLIALLLEKRGEEITISEELLKTAVQNEISGVQIIALLLDKRGNEVKISAELVKTAIRNWNAALPLIKLLKQRETEVKITQEILKEAAVSNETGAMTFLLELRGDEIKITEEVLKAAALSHTTNVMALLFRQRGDEVKITEEGLKAAVGSHGTDATALLLEQRRDEIKITEEVFRAVISNPKWESVIWLLIEHVADRFKLSNGLIDLMTSSIQGRKCFPLLLEKRGNPMEIAEQVAKAAFGPLNGGCNILEPVGRKLFRGYICGRWIYFRPQGNDRQSVVRICQELAGDSTPS